MAAESSLASTPLRSVASNTRCELRGSISTSFTTTSGLLTRFQFLPSSTLFHKTLGGTGVNDGRIARILLEHAGASRGEGNALDLLELIAAADALINAGAGAGENFRRIGRADDDRENVGIVDHAFIDVLPVGAAVAGLPRQVPGSGIDHVRIFGIDRDGFDVLDDPSLEEMCCQLLPPSLLR